MWYIAHQLRARGNLLRFVIITIVAHEESVVLQRCTISIEPPFSSLSALCCVGGILTVLHKYVEVCRPIYVLRYWTDMRYGTSMSWMMKTIGTNSNTLNKLIHFISNSKSTRDWLAQAQLRAHSVQNLRVRLCMQHNILFPLFYMCRVASTFEIGCYKSFFLFPKMHPQ